VLPWTALLSELYWWLSRGFALHDASTLKDRMRAFENAAELYPLWLPMIPATHLL